MKGEGKMERIISSKVLKATEKLNLRVRNLSVNFNPVFGTPTNIYGDLSKKVQGKPEKAALAFLNENYVLFRMKKGLKDLKVVRTVDSATGTHIEYQQMFKKVPVFGATVTIHVDSSNSVKQIDNEYMPGSLLHGMEVKPAVSRDISIRKAKNNLRVRGELRGSIESELGILPDEGSANLCWHILIPSTEPFGDWEIFVDAKTGKVIKKRNLIKAINGQGLVYDPNPVVTSNNNTLNDNSPLATLNAQRVTRTLRDIKETVDVFVNKVTLNDTSIDGYAVAFGNGRVYIAWTGTDDRHRLNVMSSTNGRNFVNKVTLDDTSIAGPALTFMNGRLYISWTGTDSRHRLNVMSSTDGRNFGNKVTLEERSAHGPALANKGNRLYLAWTGTDSRHRLNILQSGDGKSWTNKRTLEDNSHYRPALAFGDGKLYLGWTGTDSRRKLNVIKFNVIQSSNQLTLSNKCTLSDTSIDGPTLVYTNGRLYIGWSGTDSRHRLNIMFSTNGINYRGKITLSETSPYTPALTSGSGRIFLGWTGTDSRHRLNMMSSTDELLYALEGPFCKIVDSHNPAVAPVTTHDQNGFNFGRQQNAFEDVMAYYHIDTTQRHIRQWFSNINNRQIQVDSHDNNLGGAAFYSPLNKSIGLGDGGPNWPDRGEDADNIIHEYGHSIQDNQIPGWGNHHEGGAMGEGFGDILPGLLFAEAGGGFDREVFSNWALNGGRRTDGAKHFPEDMMSDVHDDGEIWSGALWALYLTLGGNSANANTRINAANRVLRTLLESHFLVNTNARFIHGANAYLNANRIIYNSRENAIRDVLADRGMLKTTLEETSEVGMALAQWGHRTHMAWTGTDQSKKLNVISSTNGHQFENKVTLLETSPHAPALALGPNSRIYMAWTGRDSRNRLNVIQSTNGRTWTNKATLGDTSIAAPALAFFKGKLYLAWTGKDERHRLNVMRSSDGRTWDKVTLNETSNHAPALATNGTRLFLGWTGRDSLRRLNVISSTNGINFGNKTTLSDTSIKGPALTVAGGTLFILWTGTDGGHHLNVMRASNQLGTAFTRKYTLSEWSDLGPAATSRNGHVALGWVGGDDRLNIFA